MIKVYVNLEEKYLAKAHYSWELFCKHFNIPFSYSSTNFDISLGFNEKETIQLSKDFFDKLMHDDFTIKSHFNSKPIIYTSSGKEDYLSTSFYLVNSLQEYDSGNLDHIGRFMFKNSLQKKYNCVTEDLVSKYFKKLKENIFILNKIPFKEKKSRFFISHDNDTLFASFLQDGFWALKNGRIDIILKLIILEFLRTPGWFNLNKIMDINDEYDVKSTFFWLVNKGNTSVNKKIKNADYNFKNSKIQEELKNIKKRGFYNGLHKSISKESFNDEIEKLDFHPTSNRNHYLKFSIPKHYCKLDQANIKMDFSLGFAEQFGFRNSYGLPFKPFNIDKNISYNVLEVPLTVMDTTFHSYLKKSISNAQNLIIDFFDNNKNEKLLSILWHNKFFTSYKFNGYLKIYKAMLEYFKQESINPINQEEILDLYT